MERIQNIKKTQLLSKVHQICIYIFEVWNLYLGQSSFHGLLSTKILWEHFNPLCSTSDFASFLVITQHTIHISILIYRLEIYYANLGTGFVIGSSLAVAKIQMDMVHINIKWVNLILQGNTLKPASLKLQMVQMERMKSKSKDNPTENWKLSCRK